MEELQALQKRKRAIHTEMQPLSVVKVSIQAERSRKRLEPRDYQLELYERARRENTIAVLGTGTGKTLIACLLIKDILIQERVRRTAGEKVLSAGESGLTGQRRKFAYLSCRWYISCFNREM
jgi:endoribonuclease Dicer